MTGRPVAERRSAARIAVAFLAALLVAPIVGHGCHRGDDLDDEPAVVVTRDDPPR